MSRELTSIALSLCLLFLGFPAIALAETGGPLTSAPIASSFEEPQDNLDSKKMFVSFGDKVSAVSVGKAVSALDEGDMPVSAIEKLDHNVFVVEFGMGSDADDSYSSIREAQELAESAAPRARTAPVKRYKIEKADKKNPDHEYQLEFLGLFEKYNSSSEAGSGHGFESVRSIASRTGVHSTVAVIDSGFRETHAELKGHLLRQYAYDAIENRAGVIGKDAVDHGTAVASVIVANKGNGVGGYGICANTDILPIKAASDDGCLEDDDVLEGLQHIERLAASGLVADLKVVNMSFGAHYTDEEVAECDIGTACDPLYQQIKRLHDVYGITCVCAGGNGPDGDCLDWYDDGYNFPSDYDCCVAVHGVYDGIMNSAYADVNPCKDISALVWAEAASARGDNEFDSYEGTSFSSPFVASAIVSLMQINPSLTPDDALKLLQETAVKVPESINSNYSSVNGSAGVMNAEKAAWIAADKAERGSGYWNGMTDAVKVGKLTFGFQVLSAKKRTVALTAMLNYDKNIRTLNLPDKVRLGDGRVYRVTQNRAIFLGANGKVGNVVSPANTSVIGYKGLVPSAYEDGSPGDAHVLACVTLKSRNLTAKRVRDCFAQDDLKVKKIVVAVSRSHKVNLKYAKKYSKFLTERNCGSRIGKVVAK